MLLVSGEGLLHACISSTVIQGPDFSPERDRKIASPAVVKFSSVAKPAQQFGHAMQI